MSDSTAGNLLSQIHPSAAGQLSTTLVKTEVNGVPAYHLTTKANDPKAYVLADGQARLLRGPGSKGQLSAWVFTQWNSVRWRAHRLRPKWPRSRPGNLFATDCRRRVLSGRLRAARLDHDDRNWTMMAETGLIRETH
jgi:hypothetical protein